MDYDDLRDQRDRNAVRGDPVPDDATFHREHYPWGSNPTYRLPDGTLWLLAYDHDERSEQTTVYWVKGYKAILGHIIRTWAPVLDREIIELERMRREYARLP